MLTSSTTKEDYKRIMDAMLGTTPSKGNASKRQKNAAEQSSPVDQEETQDRSKDAIKLVYVTPEKISSSKRFMSQLEKVYANGRLARIVVDECHCCSNLGHDFRPDYKKLGILRFLFPNTPIMALTATASQSVIQSVLTIMNLSPIGQSGGTLLFDSPLFRPNLAYRVLTRPSSNDETFRFLVKYIQTRHDRSSGIIYCLSRKDTHVFAEGISAASSGRIQASAYHADVEGHNKELIHEQWRDGRIQVVCATIAFGLGINYPNVRFVIHVCMAKSVEGLSTREDGYNCRMTMALLEGNGSAYNILSSLPTQDTTKSQDVLVEMAYQQSVSCCTANRTLRDFLLFVSPSLREFPMVRDWWCRKNKIWPFARSSVES